MKKKSSLSLQCAQETGGRNTMELLSVIPMWLIIAVLVIIAVTVIVMAVVYLKDRTLNDIRNDVYQLILRAEHLYEQSGAGKQKMKWVVSQARKLLPKWMQAFISDEGLEKIIQAWFDGVKDLLDDGRMNGSGSDE